MKSEVFSDLHINAFAERLLLARRRKGLTQGQVATYADINPTHYNEIERGKNPGLRVATLYKLCHVLGVSADYLLGLPSFPEKE